MRAAFVHTVFISGSYPPQEIELGHAQITSGSSHNHSHPQRTDGWARSAFIRRLADLAFNDGDLRWFQSINPVDQ
jgi:hypothetical protein